MNTEKYRNLDGIDPEKLSEAELYENIVHWIDFQVASDCYRYLSGINSELATKAAVVIINYPMEHEYYGDDLMQSLFLGFVGSHDEEAAFQYIKDNYSRVEPIVFAEMLETAVMQRDSPTLKEIRPLLKKYIQDKKNDKAFFEEIKSRAPTSPDAVEDFLNFMQVNSK